MRLEVGLRRGRGDGTKGLDSGRKEGPVHLAESADSQYRNRTNTSKTAICLSPLPPPTH